MKFNALQVDRNAHGSCWKGSPLGWASGYGLDNRWEESGWQAAGVVSHSQVLELVIGHNCSMNGHNTIFLDDILPETYMKNAMSSYNPFALERAINRDAWRCLWQWANEKGGYLLSLKHVKVVTMTTGKKPGRVACQLIRLQHCYGVDSCPPTPIRGTYQVQEYLNPIVAYYLQNVQMKLRCQ